MRILISSPWVFDTVYHEVLPREYPEQTARRRAWNRLTKWRIVESRIEAKNHPALKLPDGTLVMTARMKAQLRYFNDYR